MVYVAACASISPATIAPTSSSTTSSSGAPLNAFNRPNYLRHPIITTTWERVLAVLSLLWVRGLPVNLMLRGLR